MPVIIQRPIAYIQPFNSQYLCSMLKHYIQYFRAKLKEGSQEEVRTHCDVSADKQWCQMHQYSYFTYEYEVWK